MRTIWSPLALERLQDIVDYVKVESPVSAAELVQQVFTAVKRLEAFPESGRRLPEYPRSKYRELIVSTYRVIYVVHAKTVIVLTVRHQRRELTRKDLSGK